MKSERLFINMLMATLWLYFAYINLSSFIASGRVTYLLFVLAQTELVVFFLIRKEPRHISLRSSEVALALVGSFAVLLYQPVAAMQSAEYILLGSLFIYMAVIMEMFGALSLNTSYGICAANRGVKTRGLYAYIRHPIYLGSFFLYIGYVLLNPSIFNVVLLCIAAVCQIARIQAEERLLMQSEEYRQYASEVKYRLVPFVY